MPTDKPGTPKATVTINGIPRLVPRADYHRIQFERKIVSRFFKDALRAGLSVSVYNGEATVCHRSQSYRTLMVSIMHTRSDVITAWKRLPDRNGKPEYFQLGFLTTRYNHSRNGADVIAAYTKTPAFMPIVRAALKMAVAYQR